MFKIQGLATGVGSLPYENAEEALDLIFKYLPEIPFWPQLPKRDIREGMVLQFAENLPCLKVTPDGLLFNPKNKDEELEKFYSSLISNDVGYFRISPDFASGLHGFYRRLEKTDLGDVKFIKCQVTGPFTFAAGINDEFNRSLVHDPLFMQAIVKGLSMKALWQVESFKRFNKEIIMFFDEPFLSSFGSAYTPISREQVVGVLTEVTRAVKQPGVLLGVHCCGNTDWSMFTDIPSIDIISFDAFDFMEKFVLYADNLKDFLNRGGVISWGIVPTQLFTGEETADLLIRKIKDGFDALVKKGIEQDLLSEKLIITPSCGLGTFTPEKAEKIFKLLSETSGFLRK